MHVLMYSWMCSLLIDCTLPLKSVAPICYIVAVRRSRIKTFAAMYTYLSEQKTYTQIHLNLMAMTRFGQYPPADN